VRLQGEFEEIAGKVLAGEVERGDGAVVAQLLNGARACVLGLLKAREQEELYERVEELERRLSVNQLFKRSAGTFESADEATGLLPSDRTTLEALRALGSMGAFDKEWREEAIARGLGRTTYYRSRGTLLELGHVEQVMNKYFVKNSCKSEVP